MVVGDVTYYVNHSTLQIYWVKAVKGDGLILAYRVGLIGLRGKVDWRAREIGRGIEPKCRLVVCFDTPSPGSGFPFLMTEARSLRSMVQLNPAR